MGHRHVVFTSQLAEAENAQDWNHTHPDPRLHLETLILPVENVAASGVNTMACVNIPTHSIDVPLSSSGSDIPNYNIVNSRQPHDVYPPSSVGNSNHVLSYVQHGSPCYNQFTNGAMESSVNPRMDYERANKRKTPTFSMPFDSGSTSGHYSAGSSSRIHDPSESVQPKPVAGPQFWPMHQRTTGPRYGSNNLVIGGDEFQRNVRSRQTRAVNLGMNSSVHMSSNNIPHHNPPTNISVPAVGRQWSHTQSLGAHRSIPTSDVGSSSYQPNLPLAGSSVRLSGMEFDRGYHSSSATSRNISSSSTAFQAPPTRGTGFGHSTHHGRRMIPYRASIPSYRPVGPQSGNPRAGEAAVPTRHWRPTSNVGRSNERIGRIRNYNDRFQPSSIEDNARTRWLPEGVSMVNRLNFSDSRNFFDHHRDMRLDIDNMSYEELLALGERIGDVKTGLSEEKASTCFTEIIYSSREVRDAVDEVEKCVICLEEYEDGERLARLNCGHELHISCIKKWLLRKNTCPICKASATEETSKEE